MSSIRRRVGALWRGELPLEIAFWHYAIYYGLIINLAATTLSVALLLWDAPIAWAVIVHLLPLPYSVVTGFGVWRSAGRHAARRNFATFTRVGVVAWFCFWLVV